MKKLLACIMVLAVAVSFMPISTFAATKSVKMMTYDQVLKTGSTAYCCGAEGVYRVKLSNGKVVSKKLLHKDPSYGDYSHCEGMKKKNGYIYYQITSEGTLYYLARVKASGGKYKTLAKLNDQGQVQYAIKGSKIYYKGDYGKTKKVMNLNGTGKKKTKVKAVTKHKNSNAKGYKVIMKQKGSKAITYLKTPKGTYKLGSHRI